MRILRQAILWGHIARNRLHCGSLWKFSMSAIESRHTIWKLVVKIVISFAKSQQSREKVVPWGLSIVKGCISEPMGEGIDAESSMVNND